MSYEIFKVYILCRGFHDIFPWNLFVPFSCWNIIFIPEANIAGELLFALPL